jgi:uncharacterized protein YndB with AHSA1/START domain
MGASKPGTGAAVSTADREIYARRLFDAPRELVWKVWTEPEHIGKWWGPIGFKTVTSRMEVRTGGVWEHVMHGPDGQSYENQIVYVEVVKPERMVYDHVSYPLFRSTVLFKEEGAKTAVSMRMVFESAELLAKVEKEHKAIEGLTQTFERMGEHLATYPVIVEHTYKAPIETVWEAITEVEHLKKWFMDAIHSFEAKPGFTTEFTIQNKGKDYVHLWKVLEVVPGKKIAVEWKFGGYAGSSIATMELFEEKDGTKLRLTHEGLETYPRDAEDLARGCFLEGWNALVHESLRKYVEKAKETNQ